MQDYFSLQFFHTAFLTGIVAEKPPNNKVIKTVENFFPNSYMLLQTPSPFGPQYAPFHPEICQTNDCALPFWQLFSGVLSIDALSPSPISVAFVDDHAMFRKSVASVLENLGGMHVAFQAANGQELLDAILQGSLRPDICVIDVAMPVLNGHDTMVGLRKILPDMKVLILTMMDHEANVLRMLQQGANGYLLKEEDPERLIEAIHTIIGGQFFSTEFVSSRLCASARNRIGPDNFKLSEREKEFLRLCTTDMAYKEIADALSVSVRTVEGYRNALFERLQVKSRVGLALFALQTGLKVLRS